VKSTRRFAYSEIAPREAWIPYKQSEMETVILNLVNNASEGNIDIALKRLAANSCYEAGIAVDIPPPRAAISGSASRIPVTELATKSCREYSILFSRQRKWPRPFRHLHHYDKRGGISWPLRHLANGPGSTCLSLKLNRDRIGTNTKWMRQWRKFYWWKMTIWFGFR